MKPSCVNIQMKAIKQYFPVMVFIMLYKVTFKSVDETLGACSHANFRQEPALDKTFYLFSLNKTLMYNHWNESC